MDELWQIQTIEDFLANKMEAARPAVQTFFNTSSAKVYNRRQLSSALKEHRTEWSLPSEITTSRFINFLTAKLTLREITLASDHYSDEKRFIWGEPSIYAIALSLRNNAYLTHGSAVFLHGLNDQIPQTVYVNYEQSPKPQSGALTQEGIDRAFSNQQRRSNLTFQYEGYQIIVINGKHTNRLEVSPFVGRYGETLDVTKLERTLIDITVRPAYAGGVVQVLEAFKRAEGSVSVNTLTATLKKLNYLYPYHQAIGFYMERAGYPEGKWSKLLKLGTEFDFYLAHQLPSNKKYDSKWRLFYPSSL
jgi:predicted transcriptional regulator of viral defense system